MSLPELKPSVLLEANHTTTHGGVEADVKQATQKIAEDGMPMLYKTMTRLSCMDQSDGRLKSAKLDCLRGEASLW